MHRHLLNTLFAATCALAAPGLADAQRAPCAPREVVLSRLAETYDEQRRSIGLAANGVVVETFASDSGSWTIVATRPDGLACLVASGTAFDAMARPPAGDPA